MDLPPTSPPRPIAAPAATPARTEVEARQAAEAFEAAYLAEMLKHSGLNGMPDGFGGGAGEAAFGSLLTDEYARLLAERGGIGIAEQVFEALQRRTRA